jgi:hypothetical protein
MYPFVRRHHSVARRRQLWLVSDAHPPLVPGYCQGSAPERFVSVPLSGRLLLANSRARPLALGGLSAVMTMLDAVSWGASVLIIFFVAAAIIVGGLLKGRVGMGVVSPAPWSDPAGRFSHGLSKADPWCARVLHKTDRCLHYPPRVPEFEPRVGVKLAGFLVVGQRVGPARCRRQAAR